MSVRSDLKHIVALLLNQDELHFKVRLNKSATHSIEQYCWTARILDTAAAPRLNMMTEVSKSLQLLLAPIILYLVETPHLRLFTKYMRTLTIDGRSFLLPMSAEKTIWST